MKKSKFKYKLYWVVSVLLVTLLIFLGYNEIKDSGNKVSISFPGQQDSLKLDLPDYFLSNSETPSQDSKTRDSSDENSFPTYTIETKSLLPDTSLFYPSRDLPERVSSDDRATGSVQKADRQGSASTETVAVSNIEDEKSILLDLGDVFWVNFYMSINLGTKNDTSVASSSSENEGKMNRVDYTSVGWGNQFDQTKVNSIYNTQRITQVGRNNYTSQTLINTVNSDLTVRSIGDFNSVIQKVYDAGNARISAIQNGYYNRARQYVSSNGVWSTFNRTNNEVRQRGYNNLVRTQQLGVSNTIQVIQNGSLNTIDITQEGSNNSATVRQSGSGNSVTIEQQ